MKNNNIDIYRFLYYRNGNNENYFDYDVHLRLYKYYLYLFYDGDTKSSFYMNFEFLYYVILGFSYFHDVFLDDKEDFDDILLDVSFEQYNNLLVGKNFDDISIENVIFSLSWLCICSVLENDIIENNIEMTKCLLDNNCRINKVLSKSDSRGM